VLPHTHTAILQESAEGRGLGQASKQGGDAGGQSGKQAQGVRHAAADAHSPTAGGQGTAEGWVTRVRQGGDAVGKA
jgi:hypothetical protein